MPAIGGCERSMAQRRRPTAERLLRCFDAHLQHGASYRSKATTQINQAATTGLVKAIAEDKGSAEHQQSTPADCWHVGNASERKVDATKAAPSGTG